MPNTQIFSLFTAAMTIAGLNLLGIKSAQAVSFNTNLIVNGDAELGIAAADAYAVVTVPGWMTTSNFSVYQYNSDSLFPEFDSPGPVIRGDNFFGGGSVRHSSDLTAIFPTIYRSVGAESNGLSGSSSAFQTIDLSSDYAIIDEGYTSFNLAGFLGGYSIKEDAASLVASFLDANNSTLSSASIGPVTNLDRIYTTGLQERVTTGFVPVGTRSILVELNMNVTATGSSSNSYDNNAYADNLSLVLTDAKPATRIPEPSEVPGLLIGGALAIGAIKKRQQKST
jgi:hypothetical protein